MDKSITDMTQEINQMRLYFKVELSKARQTRNRILGAISATFESQDYWDLPDNIRSQLYDLTTNVNRLESIIEHLNRIKFYLSRLQRS